MLEILERRVNIKSLVLERPISRAGLPFDPERDLPESQRQRILAGLKEVHDGDLPGPLDWLAFMSDAFYAKMLFPPGFDAQLGLDNFAWYGIAEQFEREKGYLETYRDVSPLVFINIAASLKILFPQRFGELNDDNLNRIWTEAKKELETENEGGSDASFNQVHDFLDLILLFPDRKSDINLDESLYLSAKRETEDTLQQGKWHDFVSLALSLRLVFPERFTEIKIKTNDWQMMKEALKNSVEEKGWNSRNIALAAGMKILAAEEVKITDQGLEITMPKPAFQRFAQPLPQIRKF